MSGLSRRWAAHVTILLAITCVPVTLHSYVGIVAEDCANPSSVAPGFDPRTATNGDYVEERMKPQQWREGTIRERNAVPLSYTIARGFDAKHIYYRPEYKLVRATRPVSHELDWIDVDGERVPVQRPLYERSLTSPLQGVVAYVVLYGGVPVEDPYRAQLLTAPAQVVRGRLPATLLFVWGVVDESQVAQVEARAYAWLEGAVRNYRGLCSP
jgi:hypothetical protein